MTDVARPVALVTGASSGIGAACAAALAQAGYHVFGASRTQSPKESSGIGFIAMDVRSTDSVDAGVAAVLREAGRIDLLVNCAGISLVGAVEDSDDADILAQLDTNLIGAWRLVRAVLPTMRTQGSGHIITIGSIAGSIGLPFQAGYSASKFGLAGFIQALSAEVRDFGIRAVLIEPGNYRTPINQRRIRAAAAVSASPYNGPFERALSVILRDEAKGHDPAALARLVVRIAVMRSPRLRYRAGPRFERLAPLAKALLPDRWFEALLIRLYR